MLILSIPCSYIPRLERLMLLIQHGILFVNEPKDPLYLLCDLSPKFIFLLYQLLRALSIEIRACYSR